jgi:Biotin-lipoyl like/Major Facilitator Superfamily
MTEQQANQLIKLELQAAPSNAVDTVSDKLPATRAATTEVPKTDHHPLRRLLLIGASVLALAGAGHYGWDYWTVGRFQVSTDDAYVKADSTTIAPKVSGYIASVLVGDNEPVKAGQVLAKIDDRDFRVSLEQANADLTAAKAAVATKLAATTAQQSAIDAAQATIAVDQATLTFAEQDDKRYAQLASNGYGSVQNAQQAASRLAAGRAAVARDTASLANATKQLDVLKAELAQAQAAVTRDEALRDQAQLNLSYTTITSAVDGVVGFGIGVVVNILMGFALFGTVYVLPQYLGQVQRYNAEQIGNVLAWTGLPQLLLIPLVPLLMKRFDARYVGALGLGLFAASSFMNITLSPDVAGDQLMFPNIVRAVGQALMLTPISAITTAGIGPGDAGSASGLSNMLRNLGGAVGTATLATILTKREQFHSNIIGQSVTVYRDEVRQRITDLTNYFISHGVADPAAAKHQAIVAIGNTVKRQALIMGFSDTFAVIGVILAIAAVALLLARKSKAGAAGGAH